MDYNTATNHELHAVAMLKSIYFALAIDHCDSNNSVDDAVDC